MAGGSIYLVPTPLGNFEDITLRALRVLREVELIACEDTRRTGRLLEHFQIKKPLLSYHEHNESRRARQLAERAVAGTSIAVVSDAGTPAIADPGYRVVQAAIAAGVRVVPLPGPNAAVAALSAAGLPTHEFTFKGFLPSRGNQRRKALSWLRRSVRTTVFYESPHRILSALKDISEILGERPVVAVRELTKMFEEILRGTAATIARQLIARPNVRGEFVLLVGPAEEGEELAVPALEETLEQLTQLGLERSQALAYLAWQRGTSSANIDRRLRKAAQGPAKSEGSVKNG